MNGTVVVYAEPPRFRRRGKLGVVIDGVLVGHVKQGEAARFPVAAGEHAVRVRMLDRSRSNTVTVEVVEDQDFVVTARSTGLVFAFMIPALGMPVAPGYYAVAAVLLLGAVCYAIPGLLFRVRAEGAPRPRAAVPEAEEPPVQSGLWWESDPALAKRYRKAGSGQGPSR